MKDLLTIGEFSKIKNVSIDTLRHYDKIGLLKPEYVDNNSLYRYYSSQQFLKFDIICFCKSIDISLKDIKKLFEEANPDYFQDFISTHKGSIISKIIEFKKMLSQIEHISTQINTTILSKQQTGIYYRTIPERLYISTEHKDSDAKVVAHSNLIRLIMSHNLNLVYSGGFIYSLKENILTTKSIFECIELGNDILEKLPIINSFPAGVYMCAYYISDNRQHTLDMFLSEIKKQNIKSNIIIDSYLIDGSFQAENRRFELQVYCMTDTAT